MLEFSPLTLGGFSWWNLALWSLFSLFLELLMIRWISSEILIFAYFKNFVLIACFLCFLSQPPAAWFLFAGGMLLLLVWPVPKLRWASAMIFLFCVALLSLKPPSNAKVYWSPYQKLTLISREEAGRTVGYILNTNGNWYQQILDLSPEFVLSHPEFFQAVPVEWNAYNIPYRFYPQPPSVLIL